METVTCTDLQINSQTWMQKLSLGRYIIANPYISLAKSFDLIYIPPKIVWEVF